MQLRTEITSRLGTTLDWAALIDDLEKEADTLADAEEKSVRLQSIAHLAEEVIPERERALGIYQKAWKIFPANIAALSRARQVYDEMGRPDMVAKVGEMELKAIILPRAKGELALLIGQRYLDSGQREKGEKALEMAVQLLPESAAAKDALAAATYNTEDWLDEVERLRAEAEQTEPVRAARLCLRAARILRAEMPDDPSIEQTLRRALTLDPMNSEAGYLLGLVLAKNTRWDELTANQDSRADALDDTGARALLYRRFAMEWIQRFKDKERAAVFFEKALAVAFTNGADELPSQVAAFSILRETWGARREWGKVLALVDQALGARLAEERKHLAALTGGVIAWKELNDPDRARPYFERIREVAPDSPILRDFDLAHPQAASAQVVAPASEPVSGRIQVAVPEPIVTPEASAPEPKVSKKAAKEAAAREAAAAKEAAAVAAVVAAPPRQAAPPPAAAAPRVEVDTGPETISDAQRTLMEVAAGLEAAISTGGATPDKALDSWKKAVISDPTKRAPRRRLAELLRRIERWNALVESLKEEEAKACTSPDDKVAVLLEMVEIYRDRLRLDVMVAGTLTQILNHQPANVDVLDQLMAQYESMKRWPDLVGTLKKKVAAVTEPHEKVRLHLQVANLYIEKFSNQAEAIKSFEAALELDPDNDEAAGHLKQVYEKRRDWEKLIALEKREIARGGGDQLRRSVELAKLASEKLKKPSVSIELWSAVTAIDPDNLEALGELEKLFEREKQWDKLSEVSERQAELAPDLARKVAALQKLGILYTEKVSDPERAVVAWRRLLEAEPENRRGQDALKKLYVAQKSWADLEKFYAGQGKLDEFARVLERQVDLEDDTTKATMSNRLAVLYRDQLGKPQSAVKWLERVLSLDAQNLQAAEALIPLYEASKDPKKLAGVLEIQLAQTQDPDEKKARLQRLAALSEQSLKDKLTAYGWWLRAFDVDPDDEAVRGEVERLAGETGGWPALVGAYEGAYARMSSALPLMSVVARIQESQLGDVERAIGTNKKILETDEVNEAALDALERLYLGGQRYEELLSVLGKKLELTLDPEARRQLRLKVGQIYEDELKDDARAIAAYRGILDEGPEAETERDVLAALDRMYERKEAWTELADVIVRELALVGPEHPDAHVGLKYRLGQVREKHLDDVLGAIDAYRDILDLQPAHEGARRALEKRLAEPAHQLTAAAILEPIYQKLEAWKDLVGVHEIQLAREDERAQRVELLLRIGELHSQRLGDGVAAFDAAARGFREDPSRIEARTNLDQLAQIVDDGWPRVVALFEEALKPGKVEDLEPALVHELSRKAAAAYQDRLERSDKAVEHYQRALTIEPEDADALEALDRIFTREEKYTELLEVYKKKVDLARDPEVRLGLLHRIASIWEEMLANHEQAIATYKEILGQEHEDVRALRALDRLYQHQGHWQDLADNLVRQLALTEERGEQVDLLGRLAALREQKLDETASAIDTYRQVLELAPEHPGAIAALERLLVDRTRDPSAEHELTIATILEPVYQAAGAWQKQIGVYDIMARHAFDPARKIELLHQIGELYELGDDADRGFDSYARAFREDPSGQETQRRLDRLARVHGKWPQIVTLYDEVAVGVGDDELKIALFTRLAQIHELELAQDEEAVKTHARILEVDPRHLAAASAIEAIHERNSDYARLVAALKRKAEIVDDVPSKKGLFYKAAQIEEEILEQPDEAIATYRAVLAVDDIDGFSMDALERLYSKLGRWGALKDVYAKKAELANNPDEKKRMLFVLGQVHDRELGDVPKAIETYQAILDLDPGDLGAIQALDRLYGQAGRWYDLLQILEREVELSETTGTTVALKHRIGELWEKELHDLVRSIESYREALELDAEHAPALKALDGLVHAKEGGEPVLAAQVLEPIYERAAEFDKLVDLLEVMVKHAEDPLRKVELYHRIAELHERRLEKADAAFEAFGRALREDSGNEVTLANLERLAEQTRAYATLAELYETELKKNLDPHRQVDLLLRLARAYEEELALADRAIATFRRVIEVDSENRAAIAALDRLYEAGQAWPELADILRKEIRLAGSDDEVIAISFRLGQLYEHNLKDLPQAVEVYRDVLGQDPAHSPTLSALELMFLEGNLQVEIGNIVEPLYRAAGEWEKLHKIYEVQLEKLTDVTERQGMYQRLAELAETKLAAEGGLQRAFRWWGLATLEDPRNERAYEELERLAGELSNWDELVAVYAEGLNRHVDGDIQKSLLLRTARVYDAELRDPQRAETSYMRVLAVDPAEPNALASLDRIYETSGMFNELAEILTRRVAVTDSTEDLIDLHFRLGRVQSDVLGDLDLAIVSYDKILGEDSRNRTALECLERIYFRREEWQKLYDVYEKLVDVAKGDEELAEVYARMARLSSDALGDDDRASDLWGRVIDLRGEDPIGLQALGEIYERRELWREMVDVLERQVRIAGTPPEQIAIYKRLGRVWNDKLGRERNALEAWVHAFEVDPTDLETLRHLAVLYRATQSWEELSDTLRRILEVGQMNADVSENELIELYAQLGQLEGEVLGRTNDAVEAWRRVLALEPSNEPALSALEALFTREGRWEDGIEVLEKRAAVANDDRVRLDTLLQAGAIWEDKVGDKSRAAQVYERVRAAEPANAIASAQLESIYREQYDWSKLTEVLLERVEHTEAAPDRISILAGVAKIYEEEVNDQESAFVVLQAAFKEDYAYEPVAKDLERLATGAGKWEELLADYTQVVQALERTEPSKAADLWVKIGRWYADHMSHVDYAIHSVQAALRLDPKHLGALAAMADFQRKRGSWGDLIETLGKHAAIEPDAQKRVELYLSLGELLETQLMDPMQAITAYRAALDADPIQADALKALDRLYRGAEMFQPLIDVLGRKAEASSDPEEQARLRLEIGRHWDERLNEPAAAIDAFRTVLTVDPQNLAAMRSLERLYERTGQAEAYLDVLEQQLDATPTDQEKVSLYVRMAAAWEERFGKLDRSADCYEKILTVDERNPSAFRELERLYDQEKRWDSLVDTYRRHILAATDPATRIDLYCAMGRIYEDELRDFDRAIEAYSDVLTFDPDEARSLDALGRLYEKIEEWDRAIDTTSRLVEVTGDPRQRVELLHRIGRIQDERLSDPASAEERFLAALSVDPGHGPSMQSLVGLYKKRGDWQKAATMMVRAEQHTQHPLEKVRLFSEAATIFREKMHDDARAMEYYAAALALDPEHVESGEPLAELYFRERRYAELEPVLDMLVRKAPQLKRDSKWLNDLYFRQARTADELQHNEKALKFYKAAYDLDSTHLPTLLGRANLLFKMQDWDAAGKIYQTILVQHRDAQKEGDVVDIYFRLGQVRLKLNERKKALNMFEKALELDPNHRDTLLAVIDLQAQQGDWEAVIHAKRSLLARADVEEKFKVLNEVGDTYHQKLTNQQKAIAAYNEALELKPKNHSTLQKVLDLYSETKQWKKAIEVMQQFAELEANPLRKGKYFYAAGVIARDEVKSLDDSVTFFNLALDAYFSDPDKVLAQDLQGYLKPFESIDKIHTSKKDWKSLERSYRQMIKRMPQRPGDGLLVMLWHNLGEIYRSRLKDLKAAAQAYEVAATLDPGNRQRHEILAELYMASGPEFAEKAIAEHMMMLKTEPFRIESYKALRKIYMDAHQYDKAWCVCNTLSFLKKADPEEQQFYEQYKPKGFVRAKQRITDDIWKRVLHPETDRYVSAIFSAIWQGAALVHAQPHKTFGLKRKDKRQVETDQLLFSKVFYYASQVLNVPLPEVYLQPEQPGEILLANCEEKGQLLPSFVIRGNLLQGRPEKELAFVSAKQLTYLRPEHYLKMALPTNAAMKTAFMSALLVVNPKFPIKPEMIPLVQQYLPHLQAKLSQQPQWMEQLHHVVKRFVQAGQDVDLVRWGNAVEATCHRVGFILCGDLEVAARMVSMEPVQVGGIQAKDKIKELVLYSISEDYFAVRHHLGTVIG